MQVFVLEIRNDSGHEIYVCRDRPVANERLFAYVRERSAEKTDDPVPTEIDEAIDWYFRGLGADEWSSIWPTEIIESVPLSAQDAP